MNQLTFKEMAKKKLEETYVVVYAIKNEINIQKADMVEKANIYTLIGIDIKGIRHLINIYQERITNNHFWLDCFESLKSRGLKNILFLSVDDNKNLKRTAKIAFPEITFVDSLTDIYPRFFKYTSERSFRNIASKIKELYVQKTETLYKEKYKMFKEKYNNVIQQRLTEKYLNNVESQYKYSQNIRKMLYKHSSNINYYDTIRLAFNNRNYVTEIEEIYEVVNQKVDKLFGFTSFQKKEWTLILNDLIKIYPKIEFI